MTHTTDVIIAGAGISGLCTAWNLSRRGMKVTVLERASTVGGTMKTESRDGWLVELGPNSALETTPLFEKLFRELGILDRRVYADKSAGNRYILRDGMLYPLPTSPGTFLGTSLWSASGKLRLLKEPFIGRASAEESIAQFVERRLGREFLDYAINPFVAGVYAGNPEDLSVRAAFPKLYALEERYGGLVKGMIRGRKERRARAEKAKDRAQLFSFAEGMQVFPVAIAGRLGDAVVTGAEVTAIRRDPESDNFEVRYRKDAAEHQITARSCVLAAPAHVTSELVAPFAPELSAALAKVFYPAVGEVFLGFRNEQISRPLDGFGFLVPARERRSILGTIWSSSIFAGRAPAGHAALTTFVGGSRQPEILEQDDRQLVSTVLSELRSIMGVTGSPVFSSVTRWPKAIPQYRLGYQATLDAIDRCENSHPGLYFCSNFRGGIAVGDCVMSADRVADRILGTPLREPETIS